MLVVYSLKGKTTEEHIAEVTEGVKDVVGDVVGALEIMNQPQEGKIFLVDLLAFDTSFFFGGDFADGPQLGLSQYRSVMAFKILS